MRDLPPGYPSAFYLSYIVLYPQHWKRAHYWTQIVKRKSALHPMWDGATRSGLQLGKYASHGQVILIRFSVTATNDPRL